MSELRDLMAALTAEKDQREAAIADLLGVTGPVPENFLLYVSPDVGQRLTRDGVIPDQVRISWHLPPHTAYVVDPNFPDHGTRWPEDSTKGHAWSGSHYPGRSQPKGSEGLW